MFDKLSGKLDYLGGRMKQRKIIFGILTFVIASLAIGGTYVFGSLNTTQEIIRFDTETVSAKKLYQEKEQQNRYKKIQSLKRENNYTQNKMLMIYNPYGLNVQSMYVYFTTKKACSVSYTIHVESKEISDFTKTFYNGKKKNLSNVHEYQMIGLVPGVENTIKFEFLYENGSTKTKTVTFTPDKLTGPAYTILPQTDGESTQELEDGLYAVFSEDRYLYYYDNNGVIRSEIPLLGYRAVRLLFDGDKMYFSINKSKMVEMSSLGQVTKIYDMGTYHLHHDYIFDTKGNILILGTDTLADSMEDIILKLNRKSGKVTKIVDLADLYPDYYKKHKNNRKPDGEYDWMHLNTIQLMNSDTILVSARETSSILKISGIYSNPKVEYMIGPKSMWKGTGYKKLCLDKVGDFKEQLGQHTIVYQEDASLKKGQYYLYMFDNNVAKSYSRPDYDWEKYFPGVSDVGTKGDASYYYKYLVDEKAGTYELVNSFAVPYSGYVSSTQEFGENIIVDSGQKLLFGEYDSNYQLIRQFEVYGSKYCYRVYKYTFSDFYFYEN